MARAANTLRIDKLMVCTFIALVGVSTLAMAQTPRGSRVHVLLNNGRESYFRGDYEQASAWFQQAETGKASLSSQERQELTRFMGLNNKALQSRTEGAELLAQAEKAAAEGRLHDAKAMLATVVNNPFLRPEDRTRAQQLAESLGGSVKPVVSVSGNSPNLMARTKLQQSRALIAKYNLDAAEALAHEAIQLGAVYDRGEDTPFRVLEDIGKIRTDSKKLLVAARECLKNNDFDRAEQLAHDAERVTSFPHNIALWGDSPSKVLRDVQQARTHKVTKPPVETKDSPSRLDSIRNFFKGAPASTQEVQEPTKKEADGPQITPSVSTVRSIEPDDDEEPARPKRSKSPKRSEADTVRTLLRQARQALQEGDPVEARRLAKQADDMNVQFNWWDDSPAKVLADVRRAMGASEHRKTDPDVRRAEHREQHQPAAAEPEPKSNDPRTLVRQARQALEDEKYDKAEKLARKAKTAGFTRWGLFEDNPDKILVEVHKSRTQSSQDEAELLMVEARKAFARGRLDDARDKAQRAMQLHGPYNTWETNDRPQLLLAEIRRVEKRGKHQAEDDDGEAESHAAQVAPKPKTAPTKALYQEESESAQPRTNEMAPPPPVWPNVDPREIRQAPKPGEESSRLPQRPAGKFETVPMVEQPVAAAVMQPTDPKKSQAIQLIVEARHLQKEGKLLEARQRLLAAQRLKAHFEANEERPERALAQLVEVVHRQIDGLVREATDLAATGRETPGSFERAEDNLVQAGQLAVGFGLDPQAVEAKWAWVRQCRQGSPGTVKPSVPDVRTVRHESPANDAGLPVPMLPNPMPTLPNQMPTKGSQVPAQANAMLESARMELSRGNMIVARRIAEEAFKGNPGMRKEAEEVLRSIDKEEFNQRCLSAARAFAAGMEAYGRKDYASASHVFRNIDPLLLPKANQAKLREIMQTQEMRKPGGDIVPVGAQTPPHMPDLTPGKATATDQPVETAPMPAPATTMEQTYSQQVQAMHEVQFQKLRDESLRVQREATERVRAGETDRAIEMLQEYLDGLQRTQLDPAKVKMLRSHVEKRLESFKTLQAQREIETARTGETESFEKIQSRKALADQHKQQEIGKLMKQYHEYFSEGKYKEAEMVATQAHELDPDNSAALAGMHIARVQSRQADYNGIKDRKEKGFLTWTNEADDVGPAVTVKNPLIVDPEISKKNMMRKTTLKSQEWGAKSEKEREIERRILQPISLDFNDVPLEKVVRDIGDLTGINVVPDIRALQDAGISVRQPLNFKVEGMSIKSALTLLLDQLHLTYVIKDEALQVTTPERAKGKMVSKTYQVADLIIPVPNFVNTTEPFDYAKMYIQNSQLGYYGTNPYMGPMSLPPGMPTGTPAGNMTSMSGAAMTSQRPATLANVNGVYMPANATPPTMENQLIKLITNTVAPQRWSDMGGEGTIDYYPLGMALVINITEDIQEQIAELLQTLRRLQDTEVTIEMRFIAVDEGFFERIGVNFGANILTNNAKYEPALTSGSFVPAGSGLINQFTPSGFMSGANVNGTLTSDLDIPINASSYAFTVPPFGGYPGMPGGGLSLGLAFLSDIQVFLFLEAVQGDRRTTIMQAPKLTMFNGQSANVSASTTRGMIIGTTLVPIGNNFGLQPIPGGVPATQVMLNIQPVVSGDRRFVRMNLSNITFSESTMSTTSGQAITTPFPIYPAGGGEPQTQFTSFIAPNVNTQTISVSTTAMVPDGGTMVVGGLKLMREARSEFGPPILSKVPYVNRLFKNVGYGRDSANIMLMITPRVISNEEQEVEQTGYDSRSATQGLN